MDYVYLNALSFLSDVSAYVFSNARARTYKMQSERIYECISTALQRRSHSEVYYVFTDAPNFPCRDLTLRNFMCTNSIEHLKSTYLSAKEQS